MVNFCNQRAADPDSRSQAIDGNDLALVPIDVVSDQANWRIGLARDKAGKPVAIIYLPS